MMQALTRARLAIRQTEVLGTVMHSLAEVHGDRRLMTDAHGLTLTFSEASDQVNRWAGGIARRAERGDRVVLNTKNSYELFLLCLATSRAGCIPVPINPQMQVAEVDHVIADSGARLVIRDANELGDAVPLLEPIPTSLADVAALFYTSGTTGQPKGAELSHQALVGQATAGVAWPAVLHRDEAVVALPIAHIMGFAVLMGLACMAVPVYQLESFHPVEVLDVIEDRRATVFIGVPAMFRMLIEAGAEGRDLTSIRLWGSGADAMPADLARQFKQMGATMTLPLVGAVGQAAFVEAYGLVEVGGGVAAKVSPPLVGLGLGNSIGFQLPGYTFRVMRVDGDDRGGVDPDGETEVGLGGVGELWVKGAGVIKGYWNAPEATSDVVTEDGWLRTGDLVRKGMFGTVVFVGRKKDVIKHGGYSVYAVEVQEVLERHPAVLEAAVVGLPDPIKGEVPAAVVRLIDGADLDEIDLTTWAAVRLAAYKVPKHWVAVDALPMTATSKVRKQELLRLF